LCPEGRDPKVSCSKKLLFGIDLIETATSSWFNFVDFKLCKFFKALFVLPLRVPTQIVFLLFNLF